MQRIATRPRALTEKLLGRWPLPATDAHTDKEGRGHVLVVGGCSEMPGAVLLAATAALRAGAGKLTVAVPRCVAQGLALAMPEARVVAMAETRSGALSTRDVSRLAGFAHQVGAVVIGPGMADEVATAAFVRKLLPHFRHCVMVLDAYAMSAVGRKPFNQPVILTPHCGEMAHLTGVAKDEILADQLEFARVAAARWGACVALKGADTYVAQADGSTLCWRGGTPGLAVSGSGDTLAGIVAGIAARGATAFHATAWGIVLHALAGKELTRRHGTVGFLARELPEEVPPIMHALTRASPHSRAPPV